MGSIPPPWKTPSQFWTSFGMSTTTGPGRPVRAISNAVRMVASRRAGSVTRNMCFATEPMIEGTGASWNASVPIDARATCPQTTTSGAAAPAGGAGVAGGHESRALLVCRHNQGNLRLTRAALLLVVEEYGVV